MNKRESPEINAGSMADIAFLLLIFFLVSTTLNADLGISKKLPDKNNRTIKDVNEKNVLEINVDSDNEILIEGKQVVQIEDVRQLTIDFIDNGGGTDLDGNKCDWCNGKKDPASSDHPNKAIIQLQSNRSTSYASHISVYNEILGAYNQLRNELSLSLYDMSFTQLLEEAKKDKNDSELKSKVEHIKISYPQHILEADPIK